jgi:PKHD-type hydroxylase
MLIRIPGVLTPDQVAHCRERLAEGEWLDGKVTAGPQAALAKENLQLREGSPVARELGDLVLRALERNPLFIGAALPKQVFPPLFNRYDAGMSFGDHVDNAIRAVPGTPYRIRTDLSATLFLAEPESYDGGGLIVEDTYGVHNVKLPAGDMVLYPASSLHRVEPVARGSRVAAFFWIQSLIRDDGERTLLFDLDVTIRDLAAVPANREAAVRLTATYHNLLRRWAEP